MNPEEPKASFCHRLCEGQVVMKAGEVALGSLPPILAFLKLNRYVSFSFRNKGDEEMRSSAGVVFPCINKEKVRLLHLLTCDS